MTNAIFGEDLVDDRAPTRGVVFTENVVKNAGQQVRYAERFSLTDSFLQNSTAAVSLVLHPFITMVIGRR